jgi:HPt (histidine-containing phosphotransfer) domain-containing protein
MDGSAATRAIRAIEHARGTVPIPIVAISASKRAQDAALSGEAGWNRHLFKPLSKHKLLNAIEECAPMQYAAKAGSPQMMENDRFPSLRQIVPGYLAARQKELLEMRALLAASSFAKIITIAHNLKGTGHSYGFAPLTQLGGALEHAAKQADTAAMDMQLREISDYLDRVQMPANA